jgi:Flp pilus assembly pilin Flp
MKRPRRKAGQALIEYAFLLVLLAGITLAVLVLAGNQLQGTFNDVSFEFTHLTDGNTYAQDGSIVPAGTMPSCTSGAPPQLRGHKWKCN